MSVLRCHSVSLGCPKNRVDSERLLGSLGVSLTPVDAPEDADFVFINTCGFISPAVEESVRTIAQVIADLEDVSPRPLLVVGGCLVGRYTARELAPELPEVDLWLDNAELDRWPALLRQRLNVPDAPAGRLCSTGPAYAWLKISDGCRHACSFCTIPAIRGVHRSQSADSLVEESRRLLDEGIKELVLVAQDLTAWGEDIGEAHGLRSLMDRLLPLPGLARLRLLYLYPAGLTKDFLSYLAGLGDSPYVPYFDVPLQHADEDILRRMGRPFARNPREVVERIRTALPQAALRTSLIVGFPGESEAQYETLTRFVEESAFQHMGVFAYRAEEGTLAATMPDQIPDRVKEWRRDALMERQAEISAAWLAQFEGERLSILVDAPHAEWPGLHTGRAWFQAPEIDGFTYISGPGVEPGALVEADIVECRDYDLVALA